MNKKIIWMILLITPLLPTYMVMAVVGPVLQLPALIVVSAIEYFGFMYIIALFVKNIMNIRRNKQQRQQQHAKESFKE